MNNIKLFSGHSSKADKSACTSQVNKSNESEHPLKLRLNTSSINLRAVKDKLNALAFAAATLGIVNPSITKTDASRILGVAVPDITALVRNGIIPIAQYCSIEVLMITDLLKLL